MPLYLCLCPDYPNVFERRLAAREAHLAGSKVSREAGTTLFGRAYMDEASATSNSRPKIEVPAGQIGSGTLGSTMLYRFPTIEEAWERIKSDPYWVQGVWDKDRVTVNELAYLPTDETLKLVN
ncbi:hypothetical protein D1P53_002920 [Cryptococcus gattii VGV]|nr:hypothetical protein D1P53_002920 [Cryptococcus gattii VGV]